MKYLPEVTFNPVSHTSCLLIARNPYFRWSILRVGLPLIILAVLGRASFCQVSGNNSAEAQFQNLLQAARSAEQAKDYARAVDAYRKIRELRPRDPIAHQSLGLACYLQGNYTEAVTSLERALTLDPQLWGARLYLGISYYRTNRFPKAVEILKKSRQLNPRDPMARYWLGASYLALKSFPEAVSELELASQASPKDSEVLNTLARAYAEYASVLLDRLLQVAPDSASARCSRAEDFLAQNLMQPALGMIEKAIELQPDLPGLHLARGDILWQENKFDEAAEEFHKELMNDPSSPEAHTRLATYYLSSNNPGQALPHLELAAKLRPQDQTIAQLLGEARENASKAKGTMSSPSSHPLGVGSHTAGISAAMDHYGRGELSMAIGLSRQALARQPNSLPAHRLLVRCYLAQGQFDKAVPELREILRQWRDDPESIYALGKSYEALSSEVVQKMFELDPNSYRVRLLRGEAHEKGVRREYEKALEEYRKALELKPDVPGTHFAVGRILWKMNRFDEAMPYLERELTMNPHHGLASYYLGNIYLSQGQRERAISYLEAAIQAQSGLIQAHRDLGRALAGVGKFEAAIAAYQKVAQSDPEDSSIHALMATTYRAMGKLEEARRSAEIAQQLSEKRRQAPQ